MTDLSEEEVTERDFFSRPLEVQTDLLQQTWCNHCSEVDLGMKNPREYESKDRVWIEGECLKCGNSTITEIDESED